MSVACPYCKAVVNPNGFKPGRHTPKCRRCGNPFVLVVPADERQAASVQLLVTPKPAVDPKAPTDRLPAASSRPATAAPPNVDTDKLRKPDEETST